MKASVSRTNLYIITLGEEVVTTIATTPRGAMRNLAQFLRQKEWKCETGKSDQQHSSIWTSWNMFTMSRQTAIVSIVHKDSKITASTFI